MMSSRPLDIDETPFSFHASNEGARRALLVGINYGGQQGVTGEEANDFLVQALLKTTAVDDVTEASTLAGELLGVVGGNFAMLEDFIAEFITGTGVADAAVVRNAIVKVIQDQRESAETNLDKFFLTLAKLIGDETEKTTEHLKKLLVPRLAPGAPNQLQSMREVLQLINNDWMNRTKNKASSPITTQVTNDHILDALKSCQDLYPLTFLAKGELLLSKPSVGYVVDGWNRKYNTGPH